MLEIAYNAVLLVAAIAVVRAAKPYDAARLTILGGGFALTALLLAALLGGGPFGALRLLCYALFVHGSATAFVVGALAFRTRRAPAFALLALGVAVAAVGIEAFLVEPRDLEVSRVHLTSPRLSAPLKIVVLADVQTEGVGAYEKSAIAAALRERPDLVLFAGDYVQLPEPELTRERRALRDALRDAGLAAPLGVYAVRGNVDAPRWEEIFEGLPVVTFDRTRAVDAGEVRVTGLALDDSFDTSVSVPSTERFHVVLGHAPNFALGHVRADLLVAGHTHGGQVRLPGIGPLITLSEVPRRWAAGSTALPQGGTLVVSRGVGLERASAPRLRFLCRPEIVVIEVAPAAPREQR